jgi:hypothetical protein
MPAHSVKLSLEDGQVIYVSPNRARRLLREGAVAIASQRPFALRMRAGVQVDLEEYRVQRWARVSAGLLMNGSLLERKPPRP